VWAGGTCENTDDGITRKFHDLSTIAVYYFHKITHVAIRCKLELVDTTFAYLSEFSGEPGET
jgi:hypothetical protein